MIECSNDYIWYKKKRCHRKKFKRWLSIFIVVSLFLGVFLYYKNIVCDLIFKICTDYAYSYNTEAVNDAVLQSLLDETKYSELISVEKNNAGDVVLMTANSHKINLINKEVCETTAKVLKKKLQNGIPVPILAFSGIDILSGYGNNVYIKTISISSVTSEFDSNFNSIGINQTLHSIYINVLSEVKIEIPLKTYQTTLKTSVLISETVLVGKVPEIYLNGKLF